MTAVMPESSRARGRANGKRPKDPCCVLTSELAPVVREFVKRWTREHQDLASKAAAVSGGDYQDALGRLQGNSAVGAVTIIHERTKMINGGRGAAPAVGRATIRNVLDEQNRTTELWIADSLLCAIGESGALTDGRIEVVQNVLTLCKCGCLLEADLADLLGRRAAPNA